MLSMGSDYEIININSGDLKVRIENDQTTIAGRLNLKPIYFFQEELEIDDSRLFLVMHGNYAFIVKSDIKGGICFDEFRLRDLKKLLSGDDWVFLEDRNFHEIKLSKTKNKNEYAFVAKSDGSHGEYPSCNGELNKDALIKISSGRINSKEISLISRYGNVCDYLVELGAFNDDVVIDFKNNKNEKDRGAVVKLRSLGELSFSA